MAAVHVMSPTVLYLTFLVTITSLSSNVKSLDQKWPAGSYRIVPTARIFGPALWLLDRLVNNYFRAAVLNATIEHFRSSILHALELQNAGYVSLKAFSSGKPDDLKLIVTNWGSDIFWFQRFSKHKARPRQLL